MRPHRLVFFSRGGRRGGTTVRGEPFPFGFVVWLALVAFARVLGFLSRGGFGGEFRGSRTGDVVVDDKGPFGLNDEAPGGGGDGACLERKADHELLDDAW